MPVAVAFGPRGEIYVADEAAQRIRRIEHGRVDTVAGSGNLDALGLHVEGGYKDGPARSARFDDPSGLAVGANGDIYVADAGNHCIRRISNGEVTTVAGSPDRPVAADGPKDVAAFARPHGVSLDEDGVLYVADFGGGIRRIGPDGGVATIAKGQQSGQRFVAISASGKSPDVAIYATDLDSEYVVVRPFQKTAEFFDDSLVEGGGSRLLYGIAQVEDDQFLATDLRSSAVRLYRLAQKPYDPYPNAPLVAGVSTEDPSDSAGDVDGDSRQARFYEPLGIAVGRGRVAIADTGNRKIRLMPLPDTRRSLVPSAPGISRKNRDYRILYVGASYNFYDTSWAESVAGLLEQRLNAAGAQIGLTRKVELETLRLDAADIVVQSQFIENYVPEGSFDLVVFGEDVHFLFEVPSAGEPGGDESAGHAIAALARDLGSQTKIVVFAYPGFDAESYVDAIAVLERFDAYRASAARVRSISQDEAQLRSFAAAAQPVPVFGALEEFRRINATNSPRQIFPAYDSHETVAGRRVISALLFRDLARMRPWRRASP